MSLSEKTIEAPKHWPSAEQLKHVATSDVLVILPEQIQANEGAVTAFFRADTQALRVAAESAGLSPVLLTPPDADIAGYTEYAADWILPVIVTALLAIPAAVVADLIHDRIAAAGQEQVAPSIVRYREAVLEDGRVMLREVEGPAGEVERWLRERVATQNSSGQINPLPDDKQFPLLSKRPPTQEP